MKSFKEKIEALNVKKNETWKAEAEYVRDNKWLLYSGKIALRILAMIEENEELNQAKLAETLGVSRQHINKILQGRENLTLETIYKLSQALGVELISFPAYKDSYRLGPNMARNKAKAKSKGK
jgi:plasmid maintenance system antidote protein VapI